MHGEGGATIGTSQERVTEMHIHFRHQQCRQDFDELSGDFAQLHHPVMFGGNQVLSSHLPLALTGGVIMVLSLYLWALEGPGGYHLHIAADGKISESRGNHH